jgi:tetratricopeptide (TPR) repeat protein
VALFLLFALQLDMKYIFTVLFGFILLSAQPDALLAQSNIDETLATEYFQKGEYDKAAVLYKRLMDNFPQNVVYYDSYLTCLLNIKDYATAEKDLKKLAKKKSGNNLKYLVDLGYVYGLDKQEKLQKKEYDKIIDDLKPNSDQIQNTAAAFKRREETEYAIKTYERGRKLLKDNSAFSIELANLYKEKNDYQRMFDEYMTILDNNPYEFETVKDFMQDAVMKDEAYDIFKKILLKRAQAQPDNYIYADMLGWLFMQRKDFYSAFIQAKSVDRRLHEGGRRLMDLAKVVAGYRDFDLAEKIYTAVIDQGQESPYYIAAKRGILDLKYTKITQSGNYNDSDVISLTAGYKEFLNNYGLMRQESADVILKLAEMEALYEHQPAKAIERLKEYIEYPGIEKKSIAKAKLALGDYSMLNGEIWEATLYYSQVEKMYEDDPMGHEAKFRNARLSFFNGEFEWAKAQLDVLKSSTSELIANDAMQLSLLIADNLGLDSIDKPLKLYAEADFLVYKDQFAEAEQKLDSINALYPHHSLDDEILMERAQIAFKKRDYAKALSFYTKVYTEYGKDILGDDAIFKAAELEEQYLNEPLKAKDLYEKLIISYPGSVYTVEARSRFRRLRGDAMN